MPVLDCIWPPSFAGCSSRLAGRWRISHTTRSPWSWQLTTIRWVKMMNFVYKNTDLRIKNEEFSVLNTSNLCWNSGRLSSGAIYVSKLMNFSYKTRDFAWKTRNVCVKRYKAASMITGFIVFFVFQTGFALACEEKWWILCSTTRNSLFKNEGLCIKNDEFCRPQRRTRSALPRE